MIRAVIQKALDARASRLRGREFQEKASRLGIPTGHRGWRDEERAAIEQAVRDGRVVRIEQGEWRS